RRTERKLIEDYEAMLAKLVDALTVDNHRVAVALASIPEKIRGFGHVKQRLLGGAKADEAALFEQFQAGSPVLLKAAEYPQAGLLSLVAFQNRPAAVADAMAVLLQTGRDLEFIGD